MGLCGLYGFKPTFTWKGKLESCNEIIGSERTIVQLVQTNYQTTIVIRSWDLKMYDSFKKNVIANKKIDKLLKFLFDRSIEH